MKKGRKEAICGTISAVCCLAVWCANVSFSGKQLTRERACWLTSLAIHGQAKEGTKWETRAGTASKPSHAEEMIDRPSRYKWNSAESSHKMLNTTLVGRRQRTNSVSRWTWGRKGALSDWREMWGPQGASAQASWAEDCNKKGSHQVSVHYVWWEIFQYHIIISLGEALFCLPGVKKENGASAILDSGTCCHQELLHIGWGFNCLNLSIVQYFKNYLNIVDRNYWGFFPRNDEDLLESWFEVCNTICGFGWAIKSQKNMTVLKKSRCKMEK